MEVSALAGLEGCEAEAFAWVVRVGGQGLDLEPHFSKAGSGWQQLPTTSFCNEDRLQPLAGKGRPSLTFCCSSLGESCSGLGRRSWLLGGLAGFCPTWCAGLQQASLSVRLLLLHGPLSLQKVISVCQNQLVFFPDVWCLNDLKWAGLFVAQQSVASSSESSYGLPQQAAWPSQTAGLGMQNLWFITR